MVGFIDNHRGEHGVEPICKVLPIAPSTYYDHLAKRADPDRPSERARRDTALQREIRRVYGVRWWQLGWEGFDVARCTVARLMKGIGSGNDENEIAKAIRESAQDCVEEAGQQIVRRQLNIQPTLTIEPGSPIWIIVQKDLRTQP